MKFGPVATKEASGCILAHATKLPNRVLKKGHLLDDKDCVDLWQAGTEKVVVARLEAGDVNEDIAATRLARAANGGGLSEDTAFTGRMNLYSDENGVLVIDEKAVTAANRISPAITFATLPEYETVSSGRMVATAKIIPFAVADTLLAQAERALLGAIRVAAFKPRRIGLVSTQLPHLKPQTMDKTRRVLADRLLPSGSSILEERRVAHQEQEVAAALEPLLAAGANLLILFGASAVVDREDVLPKALELAGGQVTHLGMPVDPGNLLMLGELHGTPVIGAPGCARSPKENGFDWVLDRLLAGLEIRPENITAMGVGGLLMEIGTRPQPREKRPSPNSGKVAAIVLAAGKSSRMGGPNKLLAEIDGKPLVRHAAEAACQAELDQVVLVTGHMAEIVIDAVSGLAVETVENPDYADGMASSIRTGMNALDDDIDAVVVLLGDMPGINQTVVRKLIAAYQESSSHLIVVATANGKRGNPVLWDKRFFDALKSLSGDIGARHLIAENTGFTAEVEVGSAARLDLDTPEALHSAGGFLPSS